MKKIVMLLFLLITTGAYLKAQVPEGQPQQQQEQYDELRQEEMEQEAPGQEPGQMEQEGELTPPGEEEGDEQEQQEMFRDEEGDPEEFQEPDGTAGIDRFEQAESMRFRQLPDPVIDDFENSYFHDWEVLEVFSANEVPGEEPVPADFILRVRKDDVYMNLYYQANGQLLMQEKGDLIDRI